MSRDLDRSTIRYRRRRADDAAMRQRIRELASERRRFGYRRLHFLSKKEGVAMNQKMIIFTVESKPTNPISYCPKQDPRAVECCNSRDVVQLVNFVIQVVPQGKVLAKIALISAVAGFSAFPNREADIASRTYSKTETG